MAMSHAPSMIAEHHPLLLPPSSPTLVYFLPFVPSISSIQSTDMSSHCNIEVVLHWQDDRILKHDPHTDTYYFNPECFEGLSGNDISSWEGRVWRPKLELDYVVEKGDEAPSVFNVEVIRNRDGTPHVMMYLSFTATVRHTMNLRWFPFDTQAIVYWFVLDCSAVDTAVLVPHDLTHMLDASECLGDRVESGADGYRIRQARLVPNICQEDWARVMSKFHIRTESSKASESSGKLLLHSNMEVRVLITRVSFFFMAKVILIVYGLIAMAPITFYFDVDAVVDRVTVSSTLVLTAVAFQYATSAYLPILPYMTALDNVILIMYGLFALCYFQNFAVFRVSMADADAADVLDETSMYFYGIVTLISLVYVAFAWKKGAAIPEKFTHWRAETLNFVPRVLIEKLPKAKQDALRAVPAYVKLGHFEQTDDFKAKMTPTWRELERRFDALSESLVKTLLPDHADQNCQNEGIGNAARKSLQHLMNRMTGHEKSDKESE